MTHTPAILIVLLAASLPAAAQAPAPAPPAASSPKTAELAEDLRLLTILGELRPRREQLTELAALAATAKDELAAIETEARGRLESQREALLAAREALLRGGAPPSTVDGQVTAASQAAYGIRTGKTDALIASLATKVRTLLSPEQASVIESSLAPAADQPWRHYVSPATAAATTTTAAGRLPSDPARWLKELRDLRTRAAQAGDSKPAVDAFAKRLASGARGGTPLFDQALEQARTLANQALALPPNLFAQREWELARLAAKQELATRNQQRALDGRPAQTFDAPRWLVEQVLLSPRAPALLAERAASP